MRLLSSPSAIARTAVLIRRVPSAGSACIPPCPPLSAGPLCPVPRSAPFTVRPVRPVRPSPSTPPPDPLKHPLQIDSQRGSAGIRLPFQAVGKDVWPFTAREPPFHDAAVEIDDPILDALLLVKQAAW